MVLIISSVHTVHYREKSNRAVQYRYIVSQLPNFTTLAYGNGLIQNSTNLAECNRLVLR